MDRREFLKQTALGIGALSLGNGLLGCAGLTDEKPNIMLIMVDDMGYSDLGCFGSEIPTPNIDKLAQNGVRYTHFYNAARCCPSRASILTGLYPHQAGIGGMVSAKYGNPAYQGYLNNESVTLAEVLKSSGYSTYMSGKWHVGEERPNWPRDRGFDEYFGLIGGAANYFDIKKSKAEDAIRTMALNDEPWTPPEDGFYMTNAITDKAVEYVKKSGQEENPFFMYVAYTAPHWPLHALPEDIEKFIGKYTGGWDEVRETRYQRMLEMGILEESWALSPRDEEIPPWEEVTDKEKRDRLFAIYAAMIYRLDIGIGQIMDELEAQGKLENTLVMFVSDNGASSEYGVFGRDSRNNGVEIGGEDSYHTYGLSWSNASNTPFRENKKWTHEGGIATPFIASWPAVIKKGGTINRDVGHIVDVMATCIDVAGVEYPTEYNGNSIKSMEGRSLVPTLMGKQGAERGDLFWEHLGNRAARRGKWKLVAEKKGDWELYDMDSDRSELNDLSTEMPELRDELIQAWKSWAERVGVEHI